MDHVISDEQRRARRLRRSKPWVIAALLTVAAIAFGLGQLGPSLDRSTLSIATVERGPIEAVISAVGTIVPAFEETVSSPLDAEVRNVLVSLGQAVEEGQPLIELDKNDAELELNRLQQELALKKEELRSNDLQQADAVREAQSRYDLLAIDFEVRDVKLDRLVKLGEPGPLSAQELLEAKLNLKRTGIEMNQLQELIKSLRARRAAENERLRLACAIAEKQIEEQNRRLRLASVVAPRGGVLTYLVDKRGAAVKTGEVLATIAGEDSFRVVATVSNFYAPQLKVGQRVKIHDSGTAIVSGRVDRVVPSSDGQITVFVELDDPTSKQLRANARVNATIVTAEKPSGLRVRRGSALDATGVQYVYLIKEDEAVRTKVRTGLVSSQTIEIIEGLKSGDQVIVSDTSKYEADTISLN